MDDSDDIHLLVIVIHRINDSIVSEPIAVMARKGTFQNLDVGMSSGSSFQHLKTAGEFFRKRLFGRGENLPGLGEQDDLIHPCGSSAS